MSADDRFKPPTSAVRDVDVEPNDARAAIVVLAMFGLLELAFVATHAAGDVELTSAGALRPIGLLFAVVGLGWLYFGIARLVLRAPIRPRHFLIAIVALLLCLLSWWNGDGFHVVAPFAAGVVLAGAGWRIAQRVERAAPPPESP